MENLQYKGRTAKLYQTSRGDWAVSYHDDCGRRRVTRRRTLDGARQAARDKLGALSEVEQLDQLPHSQLKALVSIERHLRSFGVSFESGLLDIDVALSKIRGRTLTEAVDYYISKVPLNICLKTPAEVTAELLEERRTVKRGERGASKAHVMDLEYRLNRFCEAFACPLAHITAPDIERWLVGLQNVNGGELSARSRKNYRTAVSVLCQFAKTKGYLPKAWDEMEHVPVAKLPPRMPSVLAPAQVRRLVEAVGPSGKAYVILAAWCFVRRSEVVDHQLDWSNVDLGKQRIYIPAGPGGTKTWRDRFIPVSDNAAAWLAPLAKRSGPIAPRDLEHVIGRAAKSAGIEWKRNILRDSCISYALPLHGADKVSGWAGNSPDQIRKQYRKPVPDEDARDWWEVWPEEAPIARPQFG